MYYAFGVMWSIAAGIQFGLGFTSDDRFTSVFCMSLAGFSLGMSALYFIKGVRDV